MKIRLLPVALAFFTSLGAALGQAPSTDIFVFEVDGSRLGPAQRVTDREGYDNQPKFLPGGKELVYSSLRDGQTDLYRHDLRNAKTTRIAATAESEYSPTPIPGTRSISLVRDYGDLKQQLWSVDLRSGKETLLLPDVSPVGYHAWVDENAVILFVLGEPHTLQLAEIGPGEAKVLADSPGRGLARIPGRKQMSYVDKTGDEWWLTEIDAATGDRERLIATPDGREDYAWAPDGSVWIGDDSRLLRWMPGDPDGWQPLVDLDGQGVYGITRVTFSDNGKRLAVVGQRPPADLTQAYRTEAGQILGAALTDSEGWDKLTHLATVIGHRLSGSTGLEQAISWAAETMEAEGLQVRKQPVQVPHWVRGKESLTVIEPGERELRILGLGDSVGTPPDGITAAVVVVSSFDELETLGREAVEGKIVVYAVEWEGYGSTVQFRSRGPSRAAALGAVAALTRSATGHSLSTPHTGALRYDEEQPKIPAAALTPEDAAWFRRMAELGREVTVRLKMEAKMHEDAESFNVIAEIPGSERPEEIVVMGGHYDSWDVGQGVHDDGAACIAAWQALRLIDQLDLRPRRTLRVVLWTNEENGLRGGSGYHAALSDEEIAAHVAAIEMDGGVENPVGFGFGLSGIDHDAEERDPVYERALVKLEQIGKLLEAIDAHDIRRGGGGADIGPLMRSGVPGLGLRTVGEHYFDWHHTDADTLDKVDPQAFRKAIALLGVMGYVLADMPERLVPVE
jgi:carboxypeptidase Q